MIPDNRLFSAADALLEAVADKSGHGSVVMCVDSPAEGEEFPEGAFTAAELTEALTLLMRLGLVDSRMLGAPDPD